MIGTDFEDIELPQPNLNEKSPAVTARIGAHDHCRTAGALPSLLILNRQQFGYHSDTYYYCQYLREAFDITYLCWDYGRPRFQLDGVNVKYVSRQGSKLRRYCRFIEAAISESRRPVDLVFAKYFPAATLLRIFASRRRYILDIRTRAVVGNFLILKALNALLYVEARCFEHITVISESLAQRLSLPPERTHVLPLGGESLEIPDKRFPEMRLLYVGTLAGRRIHETVLGLAEYLKRPSNESTCNYVIIGSGFNREEDELRQLVSRLGLTDIVKVLGFVPRNELREHFEQQNIGVVYIPITEYFDTQPPTKLFEYLLAGMPVIATRTRENARIVSDQNGVLISDSKESFSDGLARLQAHLSRFSSEKIRGDATQFTWPVIVKTNLLPYLRALL